MIASFRFRYPHFYLFYTGLMEIQRQSSHKGKDKAKQHKTGRETTDRKSSEEKEKEEPVWSWLNKSNATINNATATGNTTRCVSLTNY